MTSRPALVLQPLQLAEQYPASRLEALGNRTALQKTPTPHGWAVKSAVVSTAGVYSRAVVVGRGWRGLSIYLSTGCALNRFPSAHRRYIVDSPYQRNTDERWNNRATIRSKSTKSKMKRSAIPSLPPLRFCSEPESEPVSALHVARPIGIRRCVCIPLPLPPLPFVAEVSPTSTDTESLTSSVQEYLFENGRRYHAYFGTDKNLMPTDEKEQDRMDMHHEIMLMQLEGALYKAPLSNPHRILDVGTGTGIWAIDMADKFPMAEVFGTDLRYVRSEERREEKGDADGCRWLRIAPSSRDGIPPPPPPIELAVAPRC